MDEQVLEDFKFHQETVSRDANSPLHLIREKEMEISGRVLAAKREAEEIVATARKKAAEAIVRAEGEAVGLAAKREEEVLAEAEADAERIRTGSEQEAADLDAVVTGRVPDAAAFLVDAATGARR